MGFGKNRVMSLPDAVAKVQQEHMGMEQGGTDNPSALPDEDDEPEAKGQLDLAWIRRRQQSRRISARCAATPRSSTSKDARSASPAGTASADDIGLYRWIPPGFRGTFFITLPRTSCFLLQTKPR
jgi:hypothetical protein